MIASLSRASSPPESICADMQLYTVDLELGGHARYNMTIKIKGQSFSRLSLSHQIPEGPGQSGEM